MYKADPQNGFSSNMQQDVTLFKLQLPWKYFPSAF